MKHVHHIIPRHMGGTDDDWNKIEVTVERHAELHRRLYMAFGHIEDKLAWKMLEGQAEMGELLALKARLGWERANANGPVTQGLIWHHNPQTGESRMLKEGETPPEGWVKGRDCPWAHGVDGKARVTDHQREVASKYAKKMGLANGKTTTVRGQTFPSKIAAARHFGVSKYFIEKWMRRDNQ